MNMTSSTQFAPSRRMGIYDSVHQISMWEDTLRSHISSNAGLCIIPKADARLNEKVRHVLLLAFLVKFGVGIYSVIRLSYAV